MKNKKWSILITGVLFPGSIALGLFVGSTTISPGMVLEALFAVSPSQVATDSLHILAVYRLPLVVQAFLCGGMLAVAGAAMQAVLRNPLAEPFVLGISSGSALGLVLAGLTGSSFLFWSRSLFSFAFGFVGLLIVFFAGLRRGGRFSLTGVILTGVIVSSFFSAATMLLQSLLSPLAFKSSLGLLMGHFSLLAWRDILLAAIPALLAVGFLFYKSSELDILSLGSSEAQTLGVAVKKNMVLLLVASSLLTAITVNLCGVVGFVGLTAPHVTRMLFGYSHRWLLPISFVIGGAFLTIAQTMSRSLLSETEIPVGAVTAVLGAPFFLFILRKYGQSYG